MFVSFTCGTSAKSDLAFHLHPHFEEYVVLRNYRIDNRWGIEETASSRRFPYKRNEDFQMQIFLSYDNFLVAFEGEHYCGFTYRIPLKRIRFVQVYGDVDMVQIDHQQTDRYPILYDGMKLHKFVIYTKRGLSYYNKALLMAPVTAQLGEGLYEGSEIEITGKVKLLPFTFHINLQAGTQIWPHPLVALHINPRFLAEEKSQVIQNAYIKGKWGQEEKTTISRFRPGTSFSMKIGCQRGRYAMSLDGKPSCFFIQRCPPELVNTVYIHGDVWIKEIQYTRNINFVKKPNVVYGR
ncbi:galectin-4 [Anabrus simplex]|uniref:galectin-4 n=1 Tax=Anabrus simplex TaxID=316456 RepID=UPI0034DD1457